MDVSNPDPATLQQAQRLLPAAEAPPALRELFASAGIRFNGSQPWDIQVHDARLYRRLLAQGTLGLGESYVDGDWDCTALDEMFTRAMSADLDRRALGWSWLRLWAEVLRHRLLNLQRSSRAFDVARQHYDVGNDVFEAMLGPRLQYSCGYWPHASTLDEAQLHKLELIAAKLQIEPGMKVVEVGCGYGGLARHLAEHHGAQMLGISISREQIALARERCRGWPVSLELQDWRALAAPAGGFDRIVSVGMFEHVGPKNYRRFFERMHEMLAPDGLFLLHTIGNHVTASATDPWIHRYIFPGGKLPSASELACATEGIFVVEDWHNFGPDYDRTLMCWHANFEAAWPRLRQRYGERFRRMFGYYLMCCAGFFRSRQGQLWQLVLARRERRAAYRSVRS
jgi:cyclopropane-fatty-acyl-phospholipid synthase